MVIASLQPKPKPPEALKGFEHINRYWDGSHDTFAAKILPGEFYVTRNNNESIITTLGSCVSACIWDEDLGVGGMNHFMLPLSHDNCSWVGANQGTRYGNFAMEMLINEILKQGGRKRSLQVKVTGGGKVLQHMTNIGLLNIAFVREYIANEQLKLVSEDLGDIYPRKVMFNPKTGGLRVKKLKEMHNQTIMLREKNYLDVLEQEPVAGGIELF